MYILTKYTFAIVTVHQQGDIEKLLGQSHSLLSETYSSELGAILKSTEVRSEHDFVLSIPTLSTITTATATTLAPLSPPPLAPPFLSLALHNHLHNHPSRSHHHYLHSCFSCSFYKSRPNFLISANGAIAGRAAFERHHPLGVSRE